jgi:hypothetical protein
MAQMFVILDQDNRDIRIPPLHGVYHARIDLERLQFTEREIRQHADTLVRMLLECLREPEQDV